MSKTKKLTIDEVKSGVELGVDKYGEPIHFGDFVMYTEDCKGRSDIKFGRVVAKVRGNFSIARIDDNIHEKIDRIYNDQYGSWYCNAMSKGSITKVSQRFYELWENKKIFSI
nr:hypothetical protein [Citrobacter freundii]